MCGIGSRRELVKLAKVLSEEIKDDINFFVYNDVEYVGLETRRIDYERDKLAGTNKIEKLIKRGFYERKYFIN